MQTKHWGWNLFPIAVMIRPWISAHDVDHDDHDRDHDDEYADDYADGYDDDDDLDKGGADKALVLGWRLL